MKRDMIKVVSLRKGFCLLDDLQDEQQNGKKLKRQHADPFGFLCQALTEHESRRGHDKNRGKQRFDMHICPKFHFFSFFGAYRYLASLYMPTRQIARRPTPY